MLTIKRVATVVSNYQEEGGEKDNVAVAVGGEAKGCGRNCLGKCCLAASDLPLYTFKVPGEDCAEESVLSLKPPQMSFLLNLLLGQWDDRMNRGLFRYDVTSCKKKVIPGDNGFIAQLNEGRHLKKRPTEFRVDRVLQDFDGKKFNFTKVGQEEVLFMFEQSDDCYSHFFPSAPAIFKPTSPNVVAINVSPIEYGHVLLIPRVLDCLPQRIDRASFFLALSLAREAANSFFRVGYNSLGAFATINHLHFQAYYLASPFPVEKVPTLRVMTSASMQRNGVVVSQLLKFPVRSVVFEGGHTLQDLSDAVANSCIRLQRNNIPFNVLIADCGKRVFLFPQCYAEKQARGEVSQELLQTQVNPAVWEIGGHIVLKRREDFENASEDYAWRLLAEVSLSKESFQEVKAHISEAAGLHEISDTAAHNLHQKEGPVSTSSAPTATTHLHQDCLVVKGGA
ncbi:GDP-L-galactose phosphorylase 1-like [Rhodamnia argentea]|uniref:GDP-D-glucose phosphorylase 1 n=1 Tax=Rhodamnia argentea TaxID=178133 RepID=A0A8B8N854_9MYRT|nr:GDP-L-galactose phosphorylase 1-like [Rhodamnia argentea]